MTPKTQLSNAKIYVCDQNTLNSAERQDWLDIGSAEYPIKMGQRMNLCPSKGYHALLVGKLLYNSRIAYNVKAAVVVDTKNKLSMLALAGSCSFPLCAYLANDREGIPKNDDATQFALIAARGRVCALLKAANHA